LARALAERGDEVTCLDIVPSSSLLEGVHVELVRCDVGSWAELLRALRAAQPQVVFHAAGVLAAAAEERPQAAYRTNAVGTSNVLEAASLLDLPRVVLASTIATYGAGLETVDEGTQQRPTTMYGVSKLCAELLGEYYAQRYDVDFRAVRLPAVIGQGRGPGGASTYASLIVSEPAAGRPYTAPVMAEMRIPLIYIKDAVEALVRIAEAEAGRLHRRTYGINGFCPTAGELADSVRATVRGARIEFAPEPQLVRLLESWPRRIDDREAVRDWRWRATFRLEEAVADFVHEARG
jgi:threonine 3-dehydrogenase